MRDTAALYALIDAGTAALGLRIDPAWRDAIRANLAVSLDHADNVAAFAVPDETDPAPVFAP